MEPEWKAILKIEFPDHTRELTARGWEMCRRAYIAGFETRCKVMKSTKNEKEKRDELLRVATALMAGEGSHPKTGEIGDCLRRDFQRYVIAARELIAAVDAEMEKDQ